MIGRYIPRDTACGLPGLKEGAKMWKSKVLLSLLLFALLWPAQSVDVQPTPEEDPFLQILLNSNDELIRSMSEINTLKENLSESNKKIYSMQLMSDLRVKNLQDSISKSEAERIQYQNDYSGSLTIIDSLNRSISDYEKKITGLELQREKDKREKLAMGITISCFAFLLVAYIVLKIAKKWLVKFIPFLRFI
jgi:septal ring factor EnvC (AmiA/AmiB activator)